MTHKADTSKPTSEGEPATRKCLLCSRGFSSEHPGNRICTKCKQTQLWKAGGSPERVL